MNNTITEINTDTVGNTSPAPREEAASLIKTAMEADEKLDKLKAEINDLLQVRSVALGKVVKLGVKRFAWDGASGRAILTIFRKGEGLFSLKGKKRDEADVFSIDAG